MKKVWMIVPVALLLTGCASAETFETISDELVQPVVSQTREIYVSVPDSALTTVMEAEDGGRLYLCDGYTMTLLKLDGGDLNQTVQSLCGYDAQGVTVMQTTDGPWQRYEWVWVSAGEGGESLGRAAVLDDGQCHYCLTVMADARDVSVLEPEWEAVFASFSIEES